MTEEAKQYVPSFSILVNDTELRNIGADVLSVSVTDTCDRPDSFSFTLGDQNPQTGRFAGGATLKWIDNKLFDEGSKVKIQMGYVNDLSMEFSGIITATSPIFPEGGTPTLGVRGFSLYWKLQHQTREKPFESATDSEIVEQSAQDLGLNSEVEKTSVKYPLISPNNTTYATFLSKRAQRIGYELMVKNNTLMFKKSGYRANATPVLTLEWGKNLRSFTPNLSLYEMVTEVETRGPQTSIGKGKEPIVGKAKAGDERGKMGAKTGSEIARAAGVKNHTISNDHSLMSQSEANEIALVQLETHSLNFISGRGSCVGRPDLKAGILITLKGLGQRFSGNYYVISATHTIDGSGYRTEFEVRRNGR